MCVHCRHESSATQRKKLGKYVIGRVHTIQGDPAHMDSEKRKLRHVIRTDGCPTDWDTWAFKTRGKYKVFEHMRWRSFLKKTPGTSQAAKPLCFSTKKLYRASSSAHLGQLGCETAQKHCKSLCLSHTVPHNHAKTLSF